MNKNLKKNLKILEIILKGMPRIYYPFLPSPETLLDVLKELEKSDTTIDIKIQKVNESLIETSQIIRELETEFIERSQNLEILQREYDKYSKLADIEKEKAAALLDQVDQSVNKGKNSERWAGFWISTISGLIIFIFGLVLSPILNPFFNNLFK